MKKMIMKQLSIFLWMIASACHTPAPTSATNANTSTTTTTSTTTNPIKKVVFNTGSRGYQREVKLTKDSVLITINSSFEDRPSKNIKKGIAAADWNQITTALNGVDVTQMRQLESPTMKRAVDAADHSNIAIVTDNEYIHSFDNTDPHAQLKKLMAVILELETKYQQQK
jgi:hypothetical protein